MIVHCSIYLLIFNTKCIHFSELVIMVHPRIQSSSLVPRLFLVEERAWQHWGVGAVYFRYVTVHVICSDHALFLKIIM